VHLELTLEMLSRLAQLVEFIALYKAEKSHLAKLNLILDLI